MTITIARKRDGLPVAGARLLLMFPDRVHWHYNTIDGRTDDAGSFTLAPAPVGRVMIFGDRGEAEWARIEEGRTTEVALVTDVGRKVSGLVVDTLGQPVAGADVWLSAALDVRHGWIVAQSDMAGRFILEDVGSQYLCARKGGLTASPLLSIDDDLPREAEVTLKLRPPGGAIRGFILDVAGVPLADAIIHVGPVGGWRDAQAWFMHVAAPPIVVRSAADGSFLAEDVPAGSVAVAAGLAGYSPWAGSVDVRPGEVVRVVATLLEGATVTGTVRDESGAAVADGVVAVEDAANALGYVSCRTDDTGHYELGSLPLLNHVVKAWDREREKGRDEVQLVIAAGETYSWDPVLSFGKRIFGRVVDEQRAPMKDMLVFAHRQPPDDWTDIDTTDEDGRFTINLCDDVPHLLEVTTKGDALATAEGVRPGPDEIEIVVEELNRLDAIVKGRITDGRGGLLPDATVSIWPVDSSSHWDSLFRGRRSVSVDGQTGEFLLDGVATGDNALVIRATGWHTCTMSVPDVRPRETRDLGTLSFPAPGFIVARLRAPKGLDPATVECRTEHMERFVGQPFTSDPIDPCVRRSEPLQPGEDRVVYVMGRSIVPRKLVAHVDSGRDTIVDVLLESGTTLHLEVGMPEGHHVLEVTLTDEDGLVVTRLFPETAGLRTVALDIGLAPGRYALDARLDWKTKLTSSVEILDGGAPSVTLQFP